MDEPPEPPSLQPPVWNDPQSVFLGWRPGCTRGELLAASAIMDGRRIHKRAIPCGASATAPRYRQTSCGRYSMGDMPTRHLRSNHSACPADAPCVLAYFFWRSQTFLACHGHDMMRFSSCLQPGIPRTSLKIAGTRTNSPVVGRPMRPHQQPINSRLLQHCRMGSCRAEFGRADSPCMTAVGRHISSRESNDLRTIDRCARMNP